MSLLLLYECHAAVFRPPEILTPQALEALTGRCAILRGPRTADHALWNRSTEFRAADQLLTRVVFGITGIGAVPALSGLSLLLRNP